ncbi:hypothetical protein [Celeribacter neptunius]|uniref:Uncharacterized protein n=1 Tax=Celeribacter neptunius TaxID=588602 RepID=A0A1I3L8Y7_9RHOB|nr:hypothetical protein [Celeribacter neptunius]SFI80855.1 hypothetical protein SAMN04487991_0925 [Celeribacter neptunius]
MLRFKADRLWRAVISDVISGVVTGMISTGFGVATVMAAQAQEGATDRGEMLYVAAESFRQSAQDSLPMAVVSGVSDRARIDLAEIADLLSADEGAALFSAMVAGMRTHLYGSESAAPMAIYLDAFADVALVAQLAPQGELVEVTLVPNELWRSEAAAFTLTAPWQALELPGEIAVGLMAAETDAALAEQCDDIGAACLWSRFTDEELDQRMMVASLRWLQSEAQAGAVLDDRPEARAAWTAWQGLYRELALGQAGASGLSEADLAPIRMIAPEAWDAFAPAGFTAAEDGTGQVMLQSRVAPDLYLTLDYAQEAPELRAARLLALSAFPAHLDDLREALK